MTSRAVAPLVTSPGASTGGRERLRVIPGSRGVPAVVTVRRAYVESLEAEATAAMAESRDFATSVRARADRIVMALTAERADLAYHEAAGIHVEAERRLRQLTPEGIA